MFKIRKVKKADAHIGRKILDRQDKQAGVGDHDGDNDISG